MIENQKNILGCFVSYKNEDEKSGVIFRNFAWGARRICDIIKELNHEDYGKDLLTILIKFFINPTPQLEQNLKEIESYRKKEKSVALAIVVNNENFFSKSEEARRNFIKNSIFQKLDLLSALISKKRLDTNMDLLKSDLQKLLK
jgi:hypothetical protein